MFWQRKAQDAAATPEERTRELLSAYLDGELTAPQQAEATALIERDPDARAELDDLAMLVSALGNLGAELRAPRSFAITAPAAGSAAGAPWATFRRVEVFFRASAATAALVFVAVLFGAPVSDTPVATAPTAAMSEMTSMAAEAPPAAALMPADAARSADGAGPAPSLAPMPEQTPDAAGGAMGTTGAANEPPQSGPGEAAPVEGAATLALPGPTAASDATAAEESLPGTAVQSPSSDGVRGITAGLGAITGLLTALSALLAWNRRQQETPSSSQG